MTTPMPDYGLTTIDSSPKIQPISAQDLAKHFVELHLEDPNFNHELSCAQLWAVRKDGTYHLLSALPDVYDLLSETYNLSTYLGVIIHTSGWAAPLNEDGNVDTKPSEHHLRRRVVLASCVNDFSVGSALTFSDDKEIILDPGSATGSLAEALFKFWETNR